MIISYNAQLMLRLVDSTYDGNKKDMIRILSEMLTSYHHINPVLRALISLGNIQDNILDYDYWYAQLYDYAVNKNIITGGESRQNINVKFGYPNKNFGLYLMDMQDIMVKYPVLNIIEFKAKYLVKVLNVLKDNEYFSQLQNRIRYKNTTPNDKPILKTVQKILIEWYKAAQRDKVWTHHIDKAAILLLDKRLMESNYDQGLKKVTGAIKNYDNVINYFWSSSLIT